MITSHIDIFGLNKQNQNIKKCTQGEMLPQVLIFTNVCKLKENFELYQETHISQIIWRTRGWCSMIRVLIDFGGNKRLFLT